MGHYSTTRNCELSTLKFIEDNLATDWSGVSICKSWSQLDKVANPVVCVSLTDTNYNREELGSTTYRNDYVFTIDIFATSDGMRIDLSDWLMNTINSGWTYYTIAQSAPKSRTLTYIAAGKCRIDSILDNSKVELGQVGDIKDKYHQSIVLIVTVGC